MRIMCIYLIFYCFIDAFELKYTVSYSLGDSPVIQIFNVALIFLVDFGYGNVIFYYHFWFNDLMYILFCNCDQLSQLFNVL